MKIRGKVACPLCKKFNTHPFEYLEKSNIHDDSFFEENLAKSKGFTKLDHSTDNIIVGCYCLDCDITFSALLTLKIEIDKIYIDRDTYSLKMVNLNQADKYQQKEEEKANEN